MDKKYTKSSLSFKRLKEVLNYNPETGIFTWIVALRGISIGRIAGYNSDGRIVIRIDQKNYKAHRLAWLYMTGEFPDAQIDHINRNSLDNRWCNLRKATGSQNGANKEKSSLNKSGLKGVGWHKKQGRWRAFIGKDGKHIHIGHFNTPEDAARAYDAKAKELFGEFAVLNEGLYL